MEEYEEFPNQGNLWGFSIHSGDEAEDLPYPEDYFD